MDKLNDKINFIEAADGLLFDAKKIARFIMDEPGQWQEVGPDDILAFKLFSLQYEIDAITGEITFPGSGKGIIEQVRSRGTEYTFVTGAFGMREFKRLLKEMNPIHCFDDLFEFHYFKPMPDFETATILEKKLYLHGRESEIRTMKRLRAYVELERELYYKY